MNFLATNVYDFQGIFQSLLFPMCFVSSLKGSFFWRVFVVCFPGGSAGLSNLVVQISVRSLEWLFPKSMEERDSKLGDRMISSSVFVDTKMALVDWI